jgi:molecular chaperone GrpE
MSERDTIEARTEPDDADVVEAEIVDAAIVDTGIGGPGSTTAGDHASAAELGLELPDDAAEARTLLLRELAEARAEGSEYLAGLQRVAAEFDNYRKRTERDQTENVLRASRRIIEALLPTLDAFDAALAYEPQSPAEEKLLDGMRSTHAQMMDTLGREGFAPIAATGVRFDPAVHEAVAGGGDGDLVVSQELRRGYTLQGQVLRPSLVTVAADGDGPTEGPD